MKKIKTILLLATAILLLTGLPTLLHAGTDFQAEAADPVLPPIDQPGPVENMPTANDGSAYPFPIISYEAPETAGTASTAAPDQVVIDIWYGSEQHFGVPGTPQEWVNVLGNVSGPSPITTLTYTLNGGPAMPLSMGGANKTRLYNDGDFNVEINISELNAGENTVVINASDGTTNDSATVTVHYTPDNTVPLPYTVDWETVGSLHDAGQPVDGLWSIVSGGLENTLPGYDRNFAIGDIGWSSYEVTVPVTVFSLNTSDWGEPSFGAGIGMIVKWQGHTTGPEPAQPMPNWRRLGAMAWHHWNQQSVGSFRMFGHGGGAIASMESGNAIEFNKTYNFKVSVQTPESGPATYRFKYWPQGTSEPVPWTLSSKGNFGEPKTGSVLLVAHQMMARFGDVSVQPITNAKFKINVNQPANGQIIVTPDKSEYEYGEKVEIRVQGNEGFGLKNWTGNFSGTQNPLVFEITRNVNIGAVMEAAPQPTLNITTEGSGNVNIQPSKSSYLYGELVTLTAQASSGYKFAGWSGDLTGVVNPVTIVMDKSKNITASFVVANAGSPVSDDFFGCDLNTDVWSFVNPLGDGSYETNGTQVLLNAPADVSHNIWTDGNNSVRLMQPTQNAAFEIETKFDSIVTERYQMQGILVEQDANNFLRFETHYNGSNAVLFALSILEGAPQTRINEVIPGATPPFLRVTRPGSQWILSYSYDGVSWTQAGIFNAELNVTKTGVFSGNHSTPPMPVPAHTAIVDYFFNTAAPIEPEDGGDAGGFEVTTNVVGEGAVGLDPQAPYVCGQTVTVTALPAPGWIFTGWSGDLSSTNPSEELVISRNYTVTATFIEETIIEEGYKIYLPMGVK